jgi:DNA adenine methylase
MIVNKVISPVASAPIGWVGGKSKMRPTIYSIMPKHECYCEVFGGSFTIWAGKPPKMSKREVINDINLNLVHLMKVIAGVYPFTSADTDEFINYVRTMPSSRSYFVEIQKISQEEIDKMSPAMKAFRYYYLVKNSFSSQSSAGYSIKPRNNMNYDFEPLVERFRVNNAIIESLDFREFIERYNKNNSGKEYGGVFFIMDPPYFVADDTGYYEFTFGAQDHKDLKKYCDNIHNLGNKFMITYDDVPEVLELYQNYHIFRTSPMLYSSAAESGKREIEESELVVVNYDVFSVVRKRNKCDSFKSKTSECEDNQIIIPDGLTLTLVEKQQ